MGQLVKSSAAQTAAQLISWKSASGAHFLPFGTFSGPPTEQMPRATLHFQDIANVKNGKQIDLSVSFTLVRLYFSEFALLPLN